MGLYKRTINTNTPLLRQILNLVPRWIFSLSTTQHKSDKGCIRYKTYGQFVALSFGQLNKCYTLNDISTGIGVSETFISSLGLSQGPATSTMGDGNKNRNYKVFESLYHGLFTHYAYILSKRHESHIIKEIKDHSIKLIDSTIISLCLSMFDWAKFRTAKGGTRIHTCWDDTMMMPDVVNIAPAKFHDRYGPEQSVFSKATIVVGDRAYFDFLLMLQRIRAENVFVTRIKTNTVFENVRELELPQDIDRDILKDEFIRLTNKKAVETVINQIELRPVNVNEPDENKVVKIITNQLDWTARTVADLYKKRWDIELFFKAIK